MSRECGATSSTPAPENLGMAELLQFLSCQKCQRAARNPKLLPCLHTFCAECLDGHQPLGHCPTCRVAPPRTDGPPCQDNLFFATLQAKLSTYEKIASGRELVCGRCQEGAAFWCPECEEFLCTPCYNAHQWYLKRKSHEVQKLSDLKGATAQEFLEGAKKSSTLFCSEPSHNSQLISIYCHGCCKPLCCSCALLDGEHYNAKLYRDIRAEIRQRKEELREMKEELAEKRRGSERSCRSADERLQQLERLCADAQAEVQQKVAEMVQWIQAEGEALLAEVDRQLRLEREEVGRRLQRVEGVVRRMEAGEQLVEKMDLFASDQEVMEMHPFIRQSLEELRKERLPTLDVRGKVENFAEVRSKLDTLHRRVKDAVDRLVDVATPGPGPVGNCCELPREERRPPMAQAKGPKFTPTYTISLAKLSPGFATLLTSSGKRTMSQREKCTQASPKMMKHEEVEDNAGETSNRCFQEMVAGAQSPLPEASTAKGQQRRADNLFEDYPQNSLVEISGSEANSIVISSSDENEDNNM